MTATLENVRIFDAAIMTTETAFLIIGINRPERKLTILESFDSIESAKEFAMDYVVSRRVQDVVGGKMQDVIAAGQLVEVASVDELKERVDITWEIERCIARYTVTQKDGTLRVGGWVRADLHELQPYEKKSHDHDPTKVTVTAGPTLGLISEHKQVVYGRKVIYEGPHYDGVMCALQGIWGAIDNNFRIRQDGQIPLIDLYIRIGGLVGTLRPTQLRKIKQG